MKNFNQLILRTTLTLAFLAQSFIASPQANAAGLLVSGCSGVPTGPECFKTYSSGTLNYRLDAGNAGELLEAGGANSPQSLSDSILSQWNQVGTSNFSFTKDATPSIGVDVNITNFNTFLNPSNPLGYSPVIFDDDGSITDALFGTGLKNNILGFAGPTFTSPSSGIVESQAVMNGFLYITANNGQVDFQGTVDLFKATFLHETGHAIGLDHIQGNKDPFENTIHAIANPPANLASLAPIMFPIAISNSFTLTQADISSISEAYPNQPTISSSCGDISGAIKTSNGHALLGVNITAFKINDPFNTNASSASDKFATGDGAFNIPCLPTGDYALRVDTIPAGFTGGSRLGPVRPQTQFIKTGFYNGPGNPLVSTIDLVDAGQGGVLNVQAGSATSGITITDTLSFDDVSNSKATPLALNLDTNAGFSIDTSGDRDVFSLTFTETGTLFLSTSTNSAGLRLILDDPNDNNILDTNVGSSANNRTTAVSAGTYILTVLGNSLTSTGFYNIQPAFTNGLTDDHGSVFTSPSATILDHTNGIDLFVNGFLESSGDRDVFQIILPSRGYLELETSGGTDTLGRLRDSNGNIIINNDDDGPSLNFNISGLSLPAGTYYIDVGGFGDFVTGPYSLSSSFIADDHGNSNAEATIASTGSQFNGNINNNQDFDFFSVTLAQAGALTALTTGSTDTFIEIFDANGLSLGTNDDDELGTDLNANLALNLPSGIYFVSVSGFSADDQGVYTLDLQFDSNGIAPNPDSAADISTTTLLTLGETYKEEMEEFDIDVLRFVITEPGIFVAESFGNAAINMFLLDSNGSAFDSAFEEPLGDKFNFKFQRPLNPGTYYLELFSDFDGLVGQYAVKTTFTPDTQQVNDDHPAVSPTTVTPSQVAGETSDAGILETRLDDDRFTFTPNQNGALTVFTEGSTDTFIRLFDSNLNQIGENDDSANEENAGLIIPVTAGTTYEASVTGFNPFDLGAYTFMTSLLADDHGDSIANATSVANNSSALNTFETGADLDFFTTTLSEAGSITFRTTGSADTLISVFDANGTLLAQDDDSGSGLNASLELTNQAGATTFFIQVSPFSTSSLSPENYTFETVFTPDNLAPTALFSFNPASPVTNQQVSFDGSLSTDDGTITTYEWDFDGDRTFDATGAQVTNTYTSAGTNNVLLRVTDDGGKQSVISMSVLVSNPPPTPPAPAPPAPPAPPPNQAPVASFTFSPTSPIENTAVSFDGSSSTDDLAVTSFQWDFDGDGIFDAATAQASFTFTSAGSKTVSLTVTDAGGLQNVSSQSISVREATTTGGPDPSEPSDPGGKTTFDIGGTTDDGTTLKEVKKLKAKKKKAVNLKVQFNNSEDNEKKVTTVQASTTELFANLVRIKPSSPFKLNSKKKKARKVKVVLKSRKKFLESVDALGDAFDSVNNTVTVPIIFTEVETGNRIEGSILVNLKGKK